MIGSRNNGDQDEGRVSKANKQIEKLPKSVLADFAALKRPSEESRVVDHGHADAERVPKVHRWHGCELIHILATHPYTLRVIVADSVEESVLRREQARRHTRVDDEGDECAKISQGHRSTCNSEGIERRCNIIVPANEATCRKSLRKFFA